MDGGTLLCLGDAFSPPGARYVLSVTVVLDEQLVSLKLGQALTRAIYSSLARDPIDELDNSLIKGDARLEVEVFAEHCRLGVAMPNIPYTIFSKDCRLYVLSHKVCQSGGNLGDGHPITSADVVSLPYSFL